MILKKYSDKSFAVFGKDTKEFKAELKELGGKPNSRLLQPDGETKGWGWIFPNKVKPEVEKFVADHPDEENPEPERKRKMGFDWVNREDAIIGWHGESIEGAFDQEMALVRFTINVYPDLESETRIGNLADALQSHLSYIKMVKEFVDEFVEGDDDTIDIDSRFESDGDFIVNIEVPISHPLIKHLF